MYFIFIIFVIVPISIVLLLISGMTEKKFFAQIAAFIWVTIISTAILSEILSPLFSKKKLEKSDYYGEYIIDRDYFSGKQSDWQYNNFRFEIKKNDSIYFFITDKSSIIKTYKGKISTRNRYKSARLKITMEQPNHHILSTSPTVYRGYWSFYLVFNSAKFNNMFFKKGKWKALNN
jgi:hypothetical protein